jgi:hypothetical protein
MSLAGRPSAPLGQEGPWHHMPLRSRIAWTWLNYVENTVKRDGQSLRMAAPTAGWAVRPDAPVKSDPDRSGGRIRRWGKMRPFLVLASSTSPPDTPPSAFGTAPTALPGPIQGPHRSVGVCRRLRARPAAALEFPNSSS